MPAFSRGPWFLVALAALTSAAGAQAPRPAAPAQQGKPWRFQTRFEASPSFDNNVYLLKSNKRDNVGAPSAADVASGRYADMERASDLVTTLSADFSAKGPGLTGRDLTVTPSLSYEHYLSNGERSNATFAVELEQALPHQRRARVRARFLPSYFARNYLADAVDGDGSGSITPEERIYARGEYSESEIQVDYRHRLRKASKADPFAVWLSVGAGYSHQSNKTPFRSRDLGGPTGLARLQFDLRNGVELVTSYDLALLGSPRLATVVLLDETVFGQDLNGNGNASDTEARSVQLTDRSRTEHVIGQSAHIPLDSDTHIELSLEIRSRRFTSDEPFDVANNGRRDRRTSFAAEWSRRSSKRVRFYAGGRYAKQSLNRRADLGAEGAVDDYTRLRAHAGVRFTP